MAIRISAETPPSQTAIDKTRSAVDSLPKGTIHAQLTAAMDRVLSAQEGEWRGEITARGLLTRGQCLADIREEVDRFQTVNASFLV